MPVYMTRCESPRVSTLGQPILNVRIGRADVLLYIDYTYTSGTLLNLAPGDQRGLSTCDVLNLSR